MDISPAVDAPRPGDPITAAWASRLADAVNSAAVAPIGDETTQTPFGIARAPSVTPALAGTATMPMPFDCAIFRAQGESSDSLYIWLPDGGAEFVVWNGKPLGPASGQSIGTSSSAWVEVGSVTNDAARYVYLKFHTDANGEVDGWEIEDTATAWAPQSGGTGAADEPPQVLLAAYNIASDSQTTPPPGTNNDFPSGQNGLVQYRRGTIVAGLSREALDTDESPGNPPGESVNRYQATPEEPDPGAPIQLRQFHDTNDKLSIQPIGATGSAPDARDFQILVRQTTAGTGNVRPKLCYVEAAVGGPFWLRGANETANFGTGIKLGSPAIGYVTITVTA